KTFILDPGHVDLYKEIGGNFIREYQHEFGPAHYYLADTFNEMKVPVRAGHRDEDLARFSRTVYEGILAGDPDGVWVMQGWLFRNDQKFWVPASVKAFLASVPNDRMVILDYSSDVTAKSKTAAEDPTAHNIWKEDGAYFGKQWTNGMAHTFGGNNNVKGNLALIAAQPAAVLKSPDKGNLRGWSMCPEGIETNEVVYELMTDIGWSGTEIQPEIWIVGYCRSRYGKCPAAMKEAWSLLLRSAYSAGNWHSYQAWQARPSMHPSSLAVDSGPAFQKAVDLFLSCSDQLGRNELYRNDLIELVAQAVGGSIDQHLMDACDAHKSGDAKMRDQKASESLAMLIRIDSLMNVRPDRRLETWTEAARSWGTAPDIQAYYDINSRRLITYWGWIGLNDYATRVWSGLIRDYYVGRWKLFFQALRENKEPDFRIWPETWLSTSYVPSRPGQVDDVAAESRSMLATCRTWASSPVKGKS
ncbi:MAG: alpha-N-acetylglucosaminidase C-terminal domain-containing protein, partial [Acidobacteriaceae bacterium]